MGKKAQISGTAHRTKGADAPDGAVVVNGKLSEGDILVKVNGEWIDILTYIQDSKTAALLLSAERNANHELREANDKLNESLSNAKESLDLANEMAADWQNLAQTHERSSVALAKRVEELTSPKATGMILDENAISNIEYHYVNKEGQIQGPMARIMEAVKDLEKEGHYVNVRTEYDSPIEKK
jgi:hypothetical protein